MDNQLAVYHQTTLPLPAGRPKGCRTFVCRETSFRLVQACQTARQVWRLAPEYRTNWNKIQKALSILDRKGLVLNEDTKSI
ncbi:MAG: hypothetical protein C0433_02280 [Cyclobacterium sp.]|nr:hypothetical protein [Cyclobacterium sp.]